MAVRHGPMVPRGALDTVDLTAGLERDEYRERLEAGQTRLARLMRKGGDKLGTVLVFEGWDAAGKGGVIRRIMHALPATRYRVVPIAAPTDATTCPTPSCSNCCGTGP